MIVRFAVAGSAALLLAFSPILAAAQPTKPKPAATKAVDEDDTPSSAEQKKACDAKWKIERDKSGAKGWKAYFTYMAKCLP